MAKTNFKQIVNPDYLGAYSLDNGANGYNQVDGTILRVSKQMITDQSGKTEKLVAQTSLGKPMIIKATNGNVLKEISRSRYFEDWVNVPVTFYVELDVKSPQGKVDALRLKRQANAPKKNYEPLRAKLRACTDLAKLQESFMALLPDEKLECEAVKNEMKAKLTPVKNGGQ